MLYGLFRYEDRQALSLFENLEPDRLVLADTRKTMRSGTLDPNDRFGEDPWWRAGTPVRFHRLGIQVKNFARDRLYFQLGIGVDLLLISRVIEVFFVMYPIDWHGF